MATPSEVRKFLQDFKEEVSRTGLDVVPTEKNRYELAMTGLKPRRRKEIILELEAEDYCKGPVADEAGCPGDAWVFGKLIDGNTIYIKIKLHCRAKCLSFHLAGYPMVLPFEKYWS